MLKGWGAGGSGEEISYKYIEKGSKDLKRISSPRKRNNLKISGVCLTELSSGQASGDPEAAGLLSRAGHSNAETSEQPPQMPPQPLRKARGGSGPAWGYRQEPSRRCGCRRSPRGAPARSGLQNPGAGARL